MSRLTSVCFTAFQDDAPHFDNETISYLVYQRETCPDTGRGHWQGYAEAVAKSGYRIDRWQKLLKCDRAHMERRRGTRKQASDYCQKPESRSSEPVVLGEIAEDTGVKHVSQDWSKGVEATSAEEHWDWIKTNHPEALHKSYNSIKNYIKDKYAAVKKEYETPEDVDCAWREVEAIEEWKRSIKSNRTKALILVGPSRIGKTSMVRSWGKHTFMRGTVNFKRWDDSAKFLIIDDIDWKYIPFKKVLLTQMGEATVTDKYQPKIDIDVTMPAIVLLNVFEGFEIEEEYWKANTTVVHVTEQLWVSNQKRLRLD